MAHIVAEYRLQVSEIADAAVVEVSASKLATFARWPSTMRRAHPTVDARLSYQLLVSTSV